MMIWCKIANAWSSIVKAGTESTIHTPELTVGSGWRWVPAETTARFRVSFVKSFPLLSFSPNQTLWSPFQALFLGTSLKSTPCLPGWASYEALYVHDLTKSSVKPVRYYFLFIFISNLRKPRLRVLKELEVVQLIVKCESVSKAPGSHPYSFLQKKWK